jgi:hypothetical protein
MATVRTQLVSGQRRIITKVVNGQRRVSCSCCESEPFCCMYPADLLGSTYGANDLPDAVTVNWAGRFTGSMGKSGSGYEDGGATLQAVDGVWRLSDDAGIRNVGRCLIRGDGNLTQGDDLVEDQFEDTYTVDIVGYSIPIFRVSLCKWENNNFIGDDDRWVFSLEYDEGQYKWLSGGSQFVNPPNQGGLDSLGAFKTGFQNTPEGPYEDFDGAASWTINQ